MALFRLSIDAEDDIISMLAWTESHFGDIARRRYERLLAVALRDIGANPELVGSVPRPELGPALRSYHLFHSRERARTDDGIVRRPRHFFLYRAMNPDMVVIGRVLHDAMDIERNLPFDYGDE
jgi:toxin ParE1/3/4